MNPTSYPHFTPPRGWMNDPNGLIFHDGIYHLFYQHYPDKTVWGPMHWGHAISRDLLVWEHLPIALAPDEAGYIFSGCVVIDHQNTSGLARGAEAPWIALFTHHDFDERQAGATDFESQSLAVSYDQGTHWDLYAGNPVLPNPSDKIDFRDPNVFWHEATRSWIMCLAVTNRVEIYTSPNLIEWTFASCFGAQLPPAKGVWECPCLFQITHEETGSDAWVLLISLNPGGPQGGSGTQYFVGEFDGKSFSLQPGWNVTAPVWLDHGADNYAGLIWRNEPSTTQKHFIAWMNNWTYAMQPPASRQSGQMTLPRSLTLVNGPDGFRLRTEPVLPNDLTIARPVSFEPLPASIGTASLRAMPDTSLKIIDMTLTDPAATFGAEIEFRNENGQVVRAGFCNQTQTYFIDRSGISDPLAARMASPPRPASRPPSFQVILSRNGVELFAAGGLTSLTALIFPESPMTRITLSLSRPDGEILHVLAAP